MSRRLLMLCLLMPGLAEALIVDSAVDATYGTLGRTAFSFPTSDSVRLAGYAKSPTSQRVWMFGDDAADPAALYMARVLPDGAPDTSFGPANDGRRRITLPATLTPNAEAVQLQGAIVQADGKPLVYGALRQIGADTGVFPGLVCRLTVLGTLDAGFGTGGCQLLRTFLSTTEQCRVEDLALTQSQHVVAIGNCAGDALAERPWLARLAPSGTFDTEFAGGAGLVAPAPPVQVASQRYRAVVVRPDDRIAIAGDVMRLLGDEAHRDVGVWQFDAGGSPDADFSADGFVSLAFDQGGDDVDHARDLALLDDGRLLVLGHAVVPSPDHVAALFARLLPDGAPDLSFGPNGRRVEHFDTALGPATRLDSLEIDDVDRLLLGGRRVTGLPDGATHAGREFWVTFPMSVPLERDVRLLLTSDTATTGVVESPSQGVSIPFTVTPGQVTVVTLDEDVQQVPAEGVVTDKAVRISAQAPVVAHVFSGRTLATDGFTALPVEHLGTDYRVVSWAAGLGYGSELALVAAEPGTTTVTITPSATMVGHDAGLPFQIVLQQGHAWHASASDPQGDLTGTRIQADRRIAVMAGHSCAQVPALDVEYCELVSEQLQPPSRWGEDFIAVPFAQRQGGDVLRIVAHEEDTVISLDGDVMATLDAGQKLDISRSNPVAIRSTRPVAVAQLAKGCKVDSDDLEDPCLGDPTLVTVAPRSAWATRYLAVVPEYPIYAWDDVATAYRHFISIVAPASTIDNVYLDDVKLAPENFTPILGTPHAFARIARQPGTVRIEAAEPIAVMVYGFYPSEAYGYPAAVIPRAGEAPDADDLVVRLHGDGTRDENFAPNGVVVLDHAPFFGSTLPTIEGVVRALPDGAGVLVGSATRNVDTALSSLLTYRLLDTRVFRDGFED